MISNDKKIYSSAALRYAQALIELDVTKQNLHEMRYVFLKTPELMDILNNPAAPFNQKENVIDKIFSDKIIQNFLKIVIYHDDLDMLFEIFNACEHLIMLQNKTLEAVIYCVSPPTKEQLAKMEEVITKKHNCKDILWQIIEDKTLISGFILHVDGVEYDYSMKSSINRLKTDLTRR